MKVQISLTALWLAPALAVLVSATASRPTTFVVHQPSPAISSCGTGIPGQYSNLHHGWVCSTELADAPKP